MPGAGRVELEGLGGAGRRVGSVTAGLGVACIFARLGGFTLAAYLDSTLGSDILRTAVVVVVMVRRQVQESHLVSLLKDKYSVVYLTEDDV